MGLRTIIDAYLDVNMLLALSLGLWFIARRVMIGLGLRHAFSTQLRLLSAVFLATLISPALAAILTTIAATSPMAGQYSLNLSDFVTAQYLSGSIEMTASNFENAIGFRARVLSGIQYMDTTLGVTLVALFFGGFAIATLRLALGLYRLRTILGQSTIWRRFAGLELRVSDTVAIPFSTRTLRRRIIVVPSSLLASPGDLKMALAHEFQHLRQHDLEWEIALELLKPLFFWNPAFHAWKRKFEVLRELTCDQNVVAHQSGIDAASYCQSLLNICDNALRPARVFAVEVPRVALVETRAPLIGRGSASLLRQRLTSLMDGNHERVPRLVFVMVLAPMLLATLLGSAAIRPAGGWSYDRLMLSTIVNLERLAARNSVVSPQGVNTFNTRLLR